MAVDVCSHPWYHRKHHNPSGGFFNIQGTTREVSPLRAIRWLVHNYQHKKDNLPAPSVPTVVEEISTPPDHLRVTWLGHASALVQTPSLTVLIDPIFSVRCSPLAFAGPKRQPELPLSIADLPPVDVVLISHDHYDHLDRPTVERLEKRFQPTFLATLGVERRLRKWGLTRTAELDWWQYVEIDSHRFHCTPARHFSGRGLLDRNKTLWAGWFIQPKDGAPSIFHAGDTAYADHFSNLRLHIDAPDVAILPIGAFRPRWFMGLIHMSPQQAWQAFIDLQAEVFIPIHWGTFDLSKEPLHEPAEVLRTHVHEHGDISKVAPLSVGEVYQWQPAQPKSTM